MNTAKLKFLGSLLIALVIHVKFLTVLKRLEEKNSPSAFNVPFHIQINEISPVKSQEKPSPQVEIEKRSTSPTSTFVREVNPKEAKRDFQAPNSYENLLPRLNSSIFEGSKSGENDSRTQVIKGKQLTPSEQIPADELASHIKLPLLWRSQAKDGKATLKLSLEEDDSLWIRSLYGTPLLRAVLYENLKTKRTQNYISQLMKKSHRRDFSIVLKFEAVVDSYRILNNEAVAFEDGVEILKRLPAPVTVFDGVPLSDEHAERANRRERSESQKLQESPAFARTFTDEKLTRAM